MNIDEFYKSRELPNSYSLMDEHEKLIAETADDIYADFESRICKNCEFWSKASLCRNRDSFAWEYSATVEAGEGCNYFKRKVEERK